jgi:hypothetical protein
MFCKKVPGRFPLGHSFRVTIIIIMDVKLLWLLLYTSFYNIFLSNGFRIKSVMFRVHGKQQGVRKGVRKCAMEILSNVSN